MGKLTQEPRWVEWVAPEQPATFTFGPQRFTFDKRPEHGYRRVEYVKYGHAKNLCHLWPGKIAIYDPHDHENIDANMLRWVSNNRKRVIEFLSSLPDLSMSEIEGVIALTDSKPADVPPDTTGSVESAPADVGAVRDSSSDAPGAEGDASTAADTASGPAQPETFDDDHDDVSGIAPIVERAGRVIPQTSWKEKNRKPPR